MMPKSKAVYKGLLDSIPDYQGFLTVEELDDSTRRLAARYPECVAIREIGKTRMNHPLYVLRIGSGRHTGLVLGCPHPNEPVGAMMIEFFAESLAKNAALRKELDYTWYFVKAWDADSVKLNEGWFRGPFTIKNYVRNHFRPALFEQVDWSFPVDYKELHYHASGPETMAVMRLMDEVKPHFIYSLHNGGFGGVFWYITSPAPEVYDALRNVALKHGVPLDLGEPELPAAVRFSQGIYACAGIVDQYDYLERYGEVDMKEFCERLRCGDCSSSYAAKRHNSFTLLTEVPYFYDPRIDDMSDSDISRRDAIIHKVDANRLARDEIAALLSLSEDYLPKDNRFVMAIASFMDTFGTADEAVMKGITEDPAYLRPATVAEKFGCLMTSRFYDSLYYGLLVRAFESELRNLYELREIDPEKRAGLEMALSRSQAAFERATDFLEENMNYRVVPIKTLVSIQLECGLIVAEYLKRQFPALT